ncbi:MAG TPA: hypothetical protein DEP35_13600 [Deltaproteobacteria bacterium]|nr:hypothetical protein [Deltaproteobacteria bacterium]
MLRSSFRTVATCFGRSRHATNESESLGAIRRGFNWRSAPEHGIAGAKDDARLRRIALQQAAQSGM